MARYASSPRRPTGDECLDDRPVYPLGHPLVFEPEPRATGLVDSGGRNIYRLPERIGFLSKED